MLFSDSQKKMSSLEPDEVNEDGILFFGIFLEIYFYLYIYFMPLTTFFWGLLDI